LEVLIGSNRGRLLAALDLNALCAELSATAQERLFCLERRDLATLLEAVGKALCEHTGTNNRLDGADPAPKRPCDVAGPSV
jgi:hypothetical protein